LFCSSASFTFATPNPDTGPGCGLGKKLWEGWKGQKQIAPQSFMASTNVTGSYSFAISSGTSGCSNDGRIWNSERASLFIEINYASLTEDMARGQGEHLTALTVLLGVPSDQQQMFNTLVQERYRELIGSGVTSPSALIKALGEAMAGHPTLAKVETVQ